MAPSAPINIAVFGAGRIGYRHARTVANEVLGARLAAICDVNLEAATTLGDLVGCSTCTTDPADILENPEIDA
ncbi:MAG: Gfo/Idh/MocA family oxidoreductase, partial [Thermomicrobiales bacterium]|nr:Gfo/Idh/MocA family oxidoreductase [Thermomicrobiales bacterium]